MNDERAKFEAEMKLVYQAAGGGAMVLPDRMREAFFRSMTAWNLEHCVGSEQDEAGEWQECVWQKEIILRIHVEWAGFDYDEDEE